MKREYIIVNATVGNENVIEQSKIKYYKSYLFNKTGEFKAKTVENEPVIVKQINDDITGKLWQL